MLSRVLATCSVLILAMGSLVSAQPPAFDLVLANGRVIDPGSGLDAVRHVSIRNGKIEAVSSTPLEGSEVLDVTGLVVAPASSTSMPTARTPRRTASWLEMA